MNIQQHLQSVQDNYAKTSKADREAEIYDPSLDGGHKTLVFKRGEMGIPLALLYSVNIPELGEIELSNPVKHWLFDEYDYDWEKGTVNIGSVFVTVRFN